jgi:hypothetical protein
MSNWHRMARQYWIVFLVAVLGGCASPATLEGMTATPADTQPEAASAELRNAISIRSVAGGEPTNPLWTSEVGNAEFRAALESSLKNYQLLAEGGSGDHVLDATLVDLQQPFFGLEMEVTATATYHLEPKNAQKNVFDDTVITSYTASPSESFFAVQRLRLANEGAIRENIREFIRRLEAAY